ncbi:hypothetical protein B0H10DRAFT_2233570 [Mycena sp. CBHHK59/15]|nr:hypothetical protein B0H10DRAFT_2233570 [Mycena sp. CBHHK59/15]
MNDDERPHALVNTFFECLPKFTGLQRLYTDGIQLTQRGIVNLVAFEERINPRSSTLRVTSFTTLDDSMSNIWISLLSREALQELNPDYGSLQNLSFLETSAIFPVLEKYTGAYGNVHIFVQRPTLTHILLNSQFPFLYLLDELEGITALPNITSLTARFTNAFGKTEIETLFTLFPRLTELRLTLLPYVEEHDELTTEPTSFLPMLAANALLPSTLISLSLDWDSVSPPDPADIPNFTGLRDELIARCPGLNYIFLDGYHFLYVWWKTSWVWEATAHSYDDAEALRAKKNERKVLIS